MPRVRQIILDRFTVVDIKKAMIDEALSVGGLARKLGKSRSATSTAIHHPTVLPEVRKGILRILKLKTKKA